jgi:hypothetical protein
MTDHELLRSTLARGSECLSVEQLETLVSSDKTAHPHLAQCPRCQAELALLKSFMASEPLPDEGASVAWISAHLERQRESIQKPARGHLPVGAGLKIDMGWFANLFRWPTMGWAVPLTVAAAAIVVVSVFQLRPSKAPELQADLGRQPAIYRSQEVQLVSPIGQVGEVPQKLQWQAFEGAITYKVTMMEVDYSEVWSSQTSANSISIPAAVRAKILPGKPILWQITAFNREGQALATSQVQKFFSPRPHLSKNRAPSK